MANRTEGRSTVFFGLFFADIFEVLGEGDLQTLFVVFIKPVILEGVQGDRGLQHILEIHKTQEVLTSALRGLLDETNALEAGKGPEEI